MEPTLKKQGQPIENFTDNFGGANWPIWCLNINLSGQYGLIIYMLAVLESEWSQFIF